MRFGASSPTPRRHHVSLIPAVSWRALLLAPISFLPVPGRRSGRLALPRRAAPEPAGPVAVGHPVAGDAGSLSSTIQPSGPPPRPSAGVLRRAYPHRGQVVRLASGEAPPSPLALRARRLSRSAEESACRCPAGKPRRHVGSFRLWPSRRASSHAGEGGVFAACRAAPRAPDSPHALRRRRRAPGASGAAARTGTGGSDSPLSPASAGSNGTVTSRTGYAVSELTGAGIRTPRGPLPPTCARLAGKGWRHLSLALLMQRSIRGCGSASPCRFPPVLSRCTGKGHG